MTTLRQRIIQLLSGDEYDIRGISQAVRISEKEVPDHLAHIAKSVLHKNKKFEMVPAVCVSCDFSFNRKLRFSKPSRCPVCKSEQVESPRFRIT